MIILTGPHFMQFVSSCLERVWHVLLLQLVTYQLAKSIKTKPCNFEPGGQRWSCGTATVEGLVVQTYCCFETWAVSSTPHLPVAFGRDTKIRWSLLSGVYARGSKRSHTGGKCITCSGLTNSREGQLLH